LIALDKKLLAPCGSFCEHCEFLNRKEKPNCEGCGNHAGHPFWGECKLFACAAKHAMEHCGLCEHFPCDLFVDQFDPAHGQKSAFTRAGLLAYRKRISAEKFVEMLEKLREQEPSR
jgi:hypothetical protein